MYLEKSKVERLSHLKKTLIWILSIEKGKKWHNGLLLIAKTSKRIPSFSKSSRKIMMSYWEVEKIRMKSLALKKMMMKM